MSGRAIYFSKSQLLEDIRNRAQIFDQNALTILQNTYKLRFIDANIGNVSLREVCVNAVWKC